MDGVVAANILTLVIPILWSLGTATISSDHGLLRRMRDEFINESYFST